MRNIKLTQLFKEFFESEKSGGLVLLVCTILSLLIANSAFGEMYRNFWHTKFLCLSIELWINDGLMAIFFLLIGLELEREIYHGELSQIKNAMLPLFGAIGGMVVPAGIYFLLNSSSSTQHGIGIPMATDIAFALGILSLLGKRVPASLKIFLTALAVIDDLGAIIIIAVFYTKTLALNYLFFALGIFSVLLILNKLKVYAVLPYLIGGIVMWFCMLHSGVHATITGVLLAFALPFGKGDEHSPSYKVQHFLHKPVAFGILPIFALANTAIIFSGSIFTLLTEHYSLGIALGLIVGKPVGIFLLVLIAVSLKLCTLPENLSWKNIFGVGCLGGIGFTMSIFITLLAFDDEMIINNAKLVILLSSLVSGVLGFLMLKMTLKTKVA